MHLDGVRTGKLTLIAPFYLKLGWLRRLSTASTGPPPGVAHNRSCGTHGSRPEPRLMSPIKAPKIARFLANGFDSRGPSSILAGLV
jgi:hypothetical protein